MWVRYWPGCFGFCGSIVWSLCFLGLVFIVNLYPHIFKIGFCLFLVYGLITSYIFVNSHFKSDKETSLLIPYATFIFLLILWSSLPHPILTSFVLLFYFLLITGYLLYLSNPILGLLLLLVYVGALIILFCYLLMYIPVFISPRIALPTSLFIFVFLDGSSVSYRPSVFPLLYGPSLILGLGALLLLALVLVVFLVDIPRGGFSA